MTIKTTLTEVNRHADSPVSDPHAIRVQRLLALLVLQVRRDGLLGRMWFSR
jgi:hypothetical protein